MVDGLPLAVLLLWMNVFSSFRGQFWVFFKYLIQRFKVIPKLEVEQVVINAALVFYCPYTGL